MTSAVKSSRVVVLVKALPRPSKKYGETVCCAGITADRKWKRLYPIRFRHLTDDQRFRRWDWVEFRYRLPTQDRRLESCHVYEDTIATLGQVQNSDRFGLIDPIILPSAQAAHEAGSSLAVIRPVNTRFICRQKSAQALESEKRAYANAGRQGDFLDKELAEFNPSEYDFAFTFHDAAGSHTWRCADWETHATFFKWRTRYNDAETIRRLSELYNDEYPKKGMVFAIGNMAKRPKTWQLLGVIRLDKAGQLPLL